MLKTPDWVKHAIFYQIFPDRFAHSPTVNHPPGLALQPWGSQPTANGFQGGDLYGVTERLDYLQELGVNAIYLNPIFASASNHRYHTYDYYQVDPLLGGNTALRRLLDAAHARDIHVILDGVFNHASRGFWAFHHILECGRESPYLDWFTVQGWPLRPYNSDGLNPPNYKAWWNLPALPKFNTDNLAVREFIFGVARHWVEFGIDGWRLDVPNEIDDDSFWREYRRMVKNANPDAYLVGEIWEEARRWLQGDQFDSVMNYIFTWAALSFFGARTLRPDYHKAHLKLSPLDAPAFGRVIDQMLSLYPWEVNLAQLNLLDSHDMARALWIMGEDKSALRLCILFQMTMPGAPCIYYGDEIGLSAADDPACRGAFPWEFESAWDKELLAFYRRAIHLRRRHPILCTGSYQPLAAAAGVFAFRRELYGHQAVVAFNINVEESSLEVQLPTSSPSSFFQAWPEETGGHAVHPSADGRLQVNLAARQAVVLID